MAKGAEPLYVNINVQVRQSWAGGTIELRQELQLPACDFLAMCKILAEFQELADKVKAR